MEIMGDIGGIQPELTRILVKVAAARKQTEGGLELPDTMKDDEPCVTALVVAVGPGRRELGEEIPMRFKVKQVVIIERHSGTRVTVTGRSKEGMTSVTEYRFLEQDLVLGRVKL